MKKPILVALSAMLLLVGCAHAPTASAPANAKPAAPQAAATPARPPAATPQAAAATPAAANPLAAAATPSAATPQSAASTPSRGKAEEVVNQEVGLRYTIPSGWKKVKPDGSVICSADESLVAVFIQPPEKDVKAVLQSLGQELEKVVQEPKIEHEDSEHQINGMSSHSLSGTGKIDGKPAEWSVEILCVKKPFIVVEFAEQGAYEKNQSTYDAWEASFEPLDDATSSTSSSSSQE